MFAIPEQTQNQLLTTDIQLNPKYYDGASLTDAVLFISERNALMKEALARSVMYALEMGSALVSVYSELVKNKLWEKWVENDLPFSLRTANHYRNLYLNLAFVSPKIFDDVRLRDLYAIASSAFTASDRERFLEMLAFHKVAKGDVKSVIDEIRSGNLARYPELVQRVENKETTLVDGIALASVLSDLHPLIQAMVLNKKVQKRAVAEKLNDIYLDFQKTPLEKKEGKTWSHIMSNGMTFVWNDKASGNEVTVRFEDANEDTVKAYMEWRQSLRFSPTVRWLTRATVLERDGLKLTVELTCDNLTANMLEGGSLEVELLPDTWKG